VTDRGYQVVRLLGRGGMGVVELATGPDGRPVALKRLPLHGSAVEIDQARRRIRREADVLRSLDHPGIVRLLDVLDDGDDIVLVMPYLAGGSLHDRVTMSGPLHPDEVSVMADRLLDALAAAHRQGVVHRDVKPANVLFGADGSAHLVDFGVAVSRDVTHGLTATSVVLGTPGFMAPEQAQGHPATAASDVFSLGATLAYAATGVGPFGLADPRVLMWRAATGRIEKLPRTLPPGLRRRLQPMLERNPASRPSAAAARGGTSGSVGNGGTLAMPVPPVGGGDRRQTVGILAVVAALVVVAAIVAVMVRLDDDGGGGGLTAGSTTTTAACEPLPYQPCGQEQPAPFTDGRVCIEEHGDYDGDAANGCEAAPDGLTEPVELEESAEATLVPRDDVDTYRFNVSDTIQFLFLCEGSVTVTLTGAPGTEQKLAVSVGGEVKEEAVSADGEPASVTIKESCMPDEHYEVIAEVSSVGDARVDQPYTITREGTF
jgi:hypothetical protein